MNVKDEKGNISKLYCYNSQGLPSNCGDVPVYKNWSIPPYTSFTLYNNKCAPGYLSNPIQYDVPDGRYISFISQEDADNQAALDAATYGQAIADRTTSACIQTIVYARLSYENVQYEGTFTVGDVVVRYYADPSGSIPLNVINFPINYERQISNGISGQTFTLPFSIISNGTYTTLAIGVNFWSLEYECINGPSYCYTYQNTDDYNLAVGSYYQIIY